MWCLPSYTLSALSLVFVLSGIFISCNHYNRFLGSNNDINMSCTLYTYIFYRQVTGSRWDHRTFQELQQHVHSAIPEQIAVLLLVLIVRGYSDRLMRDHHDLVYVGQSTH